MYKGVVKVRGYKSDIKILIYNVNKEYKSPATQLLNIRKLMYYT